MGLGMRGAALLWDHLGCARSAEAAKGVVGAARGRSTSPRKDGSRAAFMVAGERVSGCLGPLGGRGLTV